MLNGSVTILRRKVGHRWKVQWLRSDWNPRSIKNVQARSKICPTMTNQVFCGVFKDFFHVFLCLDTFLNHFEVIKIQSLSFSKRLSKSFIIFYPSNCCCCWYCCYFCIFAAINIFPVVISTVAVGVTILETPVATPIVNINYVVVKSVM